MQKTVCFKVGKGFGDMLQDKVGFQQRQFTPNQLLMMDEFMLKKTLWNEVILLILSERTSTYDRRTIETLFKRGILQS